MRGGGRVQRADEEEESAFISMTDMTVSFLFIMMILLAFFATQISPKETVPRDEYDRVAKRLVERDAQVASLLAQLEIFRTRGDQALPWLMSEHQRLSALAAALEAELERIRTAIGIGPGIDAVKEVEALRAEIERLHRLLEVARESNPIERYNFRVAELRGQLLDRIRTRIRAIDRTIEVDVNSTRDALQFKGDGLFEKGGETPKASSRQKLELIARVLRDELGCFVFGERSRISANCNPAVAMIEALQVEGHTDSDGTEAFNMNLSSRRGASVFGVMVSAVPDILAFQNLRGQSIISVAGYGEARPIRDNSTEIGKDANRRMDLRFILFSPTEQQFVPQGLDDLPRLQRLLTSKGGP